MFVCLVQEKAASKEEALGTGCAGGAAAAGAAGAAAGAAGAVAGGTVEPSSCLGDAMRAALRDFTAAWTAQCEAAADGCGDDDVLPRLRRLEVRVEEQIKNIMKEEL